jgi:hypothetical protein
MYEFISIWPRSLLILFDIRFFLVLIHVDLAKNNKIDLINTNLSKSNTYTMYV